MFDTFSSSVVKKLRISKHRTMSATLIGRLAVATTMQGRRIGEALLVDALKRAYLAAQQVGSALIIVHALDQHAERFYRKYGFIPFADVARGLYIATASVATLIE